MLSELVLCMWLVLQLVAGEQFSLCFSTCSDLTATVVMLQYPSALMLLQAKELSFLFTC